MSSGGHEPLPFFVTISRLVGREQREHGERDSHVPGRRHGSRPAMLLTASFLVASLLATSSAALADPDGAPRAERAGADPSAPVAPGVSLDRATRQAGRATWGPDHSVSTFTGLDGKTYSRAPWTTDGLNGTKYFGEEFDTACGYGDRFDKGLKRYAALARLIERSGRRVLITIAPNKSSVNKADLIRSTVPHGRCARIGMKRQEASLDAFSDPHYVPMRAQLAALLESGQQAYYHIDSHWTTIGHTRLAYQLARRLDPDLAAAQRYLVRGTRTITPDVAALIGQPDIKETVPRRHILTPVTISTAPGSDDYHPVHGFTTDHTWHTSPARLTWPGRTAVIGDSFMFLALEGIRPLFRHGHFLWIGERSIPAIIKDIKRSDTVIIEIVQRYMPDSVLTAPRTRATLRAALATP